MVLAPVTILGGLPVIASCWFSGPDHNGEYDCGVDEIYWQKRDGTAGKEISERVRDRLEKESYWDAYVTEQANDWLGQHCPTRRLNPEYRGYSFDGPPQYITEGDWSEEYIKLNGDPRERRGA